jgi:endonuclease/exonuclease/phosphatase family metal-dependent hydrolase
VSVGSRVLLPFILLVSPALAQEESRTIRVLQFNVWQEGTSVENGLEKIRDVILASKADIVCFSEVRNYKKQDWTTKVVDALARKGRTFHGKYVAGDVGLVSVFPIEETLGVCDDTKTDSGSIVAWRLALDAKRAVVVASAHLDYKHYAQNLIRGYHGGTPDWKLRDADGDGEPDRVRDVAEILEYNKRSQRVPAIKAFLSKARAWEEKGLPVILAGDFNENSHLDWTEAAKDHFGHYGVAIEWPCTKLLADAGYVDAWRQIHPDPVACPGFTWPAPAAGKGSTSWAPKSDERDRIDFVFAKGLRARAAWVVGPLASYVRNQLQEDPDQDLIRHFDLPWPSDHKAVLVEYESPLR